MNLAKILFRLLLGRRLPITQGTLRVPGLRQPVTIRRDGYGIPTIDAANDEDAWYGLGFCQGQDRGFQIETHPARRARHAGRADRAGWAARGPPLAADRLLARGAGAVGRPGRRSSCACWRPTRAGVNAGRTRGSRRRRARVHPAARRAHAPHPGRLPGLPQGDGLYHVLQLEQRAGPAADPAPGWAGGAGRPRSGLPGVASGGLAARRAGRARARPAGRGRGGLVRLCGPGWGRVERLGPGRRERGRDARPHGQRAADPGQRPAPGRPPARALVPGPPAHARVGRGGGRRLSAGRSWPPGTMAVPRGA